MRFSRLCERSRFIRDGDSHGTPFVGIELNDSRSVCNESDAGALPELAATAAVYVTASGTRSSELREKDSSDTLTQTARRSFGMP